MRARLLTVLIIALLLLTSGLVLAESRLGTKAITNLENAGEDDFLPVQVVMAERPDMEKMELMVAGLTRRERRPVVWEELKSLARESQADLTEYLERKIDEGLVQEYSSIRVINAVYVKAVPSVIREISNRPDVYVVIDDSWQETIEEIPESPAPLDELDDVSWSIDYIGCREAWAQGYTGQGIVVAVFDSGVNYNHADLADHMWDGGTEYPHHGWDFVDNDNDPIDPVYEGHGSACAGHVAGDGTLTGDTLGVAPDATIMAIRAIGTRTGFMSGMDFVLEQGADVISSSLAFYSDNTNQTVRAQWRSAFDVLNLSGIVTAKSAGNNRGSAIPYNQVSTPGGVPSPWRHPDEVEEGGRSGVISCGAVEQAGNIAWYSSPGPTTWENAPGFNDYLYTGTNHIGMIFPDVSGPAGNGHTLSPSGNNYIYDFNGTSMATPHVGGVLALMLSKNPELLPVEVDSILQTTCLDLGATGKDMDFGAGLVQPALALEMITTTVGYLEGTVTDANTGEGLEGIVVRAQRLGARVDTTDENGAYHIELAVANDYVVTVDHAPFVPVEFTDVVIDSEEVTPLDIELSSAIIEFNPDSLAVEFITDSSATLEMWVVNRGSADTDVLLEPLPDGTTGEFLDILFDHNISDITGEGRFRGMAFGDTVFYLAGSNTYSNPNYIYVLSLEGELLTQFVQPGSLEPTSSSAGMRDLAYDGTYLYGSDDDEICVMDPATGEEVRSIPGVYNPNRCLAWDPDLEVLWVGETGYDIVGIDTSDGSEVYNIDSDLRIESLCYAPDDFGYTLNAAVRETSGENQSIRAWYKINPETGETERVTGMPYDEELNLYSLVVLPTYDIYYKAMVGILDDSNDDRMVGWLVDVNLGWGNVEPTYFNVTAQDSQLVEVSFDYIEGFENGVYTGNIIATHNTATAENIIPLTMTLDLTPVVQRLSEIPQGWKLNTPYPNPFNSSARVSFDVPNTQKITLKIFDVLGREVAVLHNGVMNAGSYDLHFDGSKLASGMYFLQMHAGSFEATKKMMLLK